MPFIDSLKGIWNNIVITKINNLSAKQKLWELVEQEAAYLLKGEGCPVCRQNNEDLNRMFIWFLLENYSTAPCIELLNRSGGFCPEHIWGLVKQHNPQQLSWQLGYTYLSIITYDLVQIKELLAFLGRYKLTRGKISVVRNQGLKRLIAEIVSLEPCPACVNLQDSSNRALAYLLMGLSEPEIQKAYINSDGLCLPHLKQALDLAKGQTLAELINLQLPKLYLLRNQVPCQQDQLDLLTGKKIVPKVNIFTGLEDKEIPSTTKNTPITSIPKSPCRVCKEVTSELQEFWTTVLNRPQNWAKRVSEFCPAHQRYMLIQTHLNSPMAAGEFQGHLLASKIEELETLLAASNHTAVTRGKARRNSEPHQTCPACKVKDHATLKALKALAEELENPADLESYGQSPGLCMDHFRKLILLASPTTITTITKHQQRELAELSTELNEYFRKQDYRYRDEPRGSEQTAWLRAIELYADPNADESNADWISGWFNS